MKKPNFLVIGAVRSGTTLLHSYFLQHPEIYVPENKRPEPHFFLKTAHFNKGENWYHEMYFSNTNMEKAVGEISTSYLFGEKVPGRLHAYNPSIRMICILREPKERAFSNFWHSKKNGFESLSFYDAIVQEDNRTKELEGELAEIAPYSYIGRSRYGTQFKRFLNYFPKDQFHVVLFNDLVQKPMETLDAICSFLDVSDHFKWEQITQKLNASKPEDAHIDDQSMAFMNEVFQNENNQLAKLFDLNLNHWN